MAAVIDGKKIALEIKDRVKAECSALNAENVFPKLAVILVGDDPASQIYVRNKKAACEYTGVRSECFELPGNAPEAELLRLIDNLNRDEAVSGILAQMPLPRHINPQKIFGAISHRKDVDCFNPASVGLLAAGAPLFKPCTPAGVIELLKRSGVRLSGENCVVLGRSNIVGKPMFHLLLQEDATVTVCHSKTRNLPEITRAADVLICAVGRAGFVTADMVKSGAVLIDVGINRSPESGRLCGDADFEACFEKVSRITPVPGGVGPMTIAMLMENCLTAAKAARLSNAE